MHYQCCLCIIITMELQIYIFCFYICFYIILPYYGYSNCEARTLVTCPRRNMYIHVKADGSQKCAPCSPCPKGTQKKRCSLWHNSECEPCPDGFYNRRLGSKCKPCTTCRVGEYALRRCSPEEDAICSRCPSGTFSSTSNAFRCTPCTYCRSHEELIHVCNSTSDYGCGDCKQGYFRESASGSCLPCSTCFPETFVVQECFEKSGGFSDKNCMPTDRIRRIFVTEEMSTVRTEKEPHDVWLVPVSLGFLFIILASTITIATMSIFIYSSEGAQRCLRYVRDKGSHKSKTKTEPRSDNYTDRMKGDKMHEICKKYLGIFRMWINKNKRPDSVTRDEVESVCLEIGTKPESCDRFDKMSSVVDVSELTVVDQDHTKTNVSNNQMHTDHLKHEETTVKDNNSSNCSVELENDNTNENECLDNNNIEATQRPCNAEEQGLLHVTSGSVDLTNQGAPTTGTWTPPIKRQLKPGSRNKRKRDTCMDTTNTIFTNPKYFALSLYNTF